MLTETSTGSEANTLPASQLSHKKTAENKEAMVYKSNLIEGCLWCLLIWWLLLCRNTHRVPMHVTRVQQTGIIWMRINGFVLRACGEKTKDRKQTASEKRVSCSLFFKKKRVRSSTRSNTFATTDGEGNRRLRSLGTHLEPLFLLPAAPHSLHIPVPRSPRLCAEAPAAGRWKPPPRGLPP